MTKNRSNPQDGRGWRPREDPWTPGGPGSRRGRRVTGDVSQSRSTVGSRRTRRPKCDRARHSGRSRKQAALRTRVGWARRRWGLCYRLGRRSHQDCGDGGDSGGQQLPRGRGSGAWGGCRAVGFPWEGEGKRVWGVGRGIGMGALKTWGFPSQFNQIEQGVNGNTTRAPSGYHTPELVSNPEPLDS